jgi:tetratricopeptide (TPR) repeat protein
MYDRALRGYEEAFGLDHSSTLDTVNNLGLLYADQGRLGEAEQMYERALRGYEALDSVCVQQYLPALNTLENIGDLYAKQAEVAKARAMYIEALSGLTNVLSQSSERCMRLAAKISGLPLPNQEKEVQSKLPVAGKGLYHGATKRKRALDT